MKALFGFMIISVLLLASCSTAQYTSATYDDEIYSSSSTPEMNITVTEDNSSYQAQEYTTKRKSFSDNTRSIYINSEADRTRENESSRFAAQEYQKRDTIYYEGDSVIYIEEIVEEEPYYEYDEDYYSFGYASRIHSFYRPSWRYNYYGRYYDPFYYSYHSGYPNYYNAWDWAWSIGSGVFLSWGWPYNNSYYPYYNNYWGYSNYGYGNSAINHHHSNNNSRFYGQRTNRGRNSFNSGTARASRSLNSSSINNRALNNSTISSNRKNRTRTVENKQPRSKTLSSKQRTITDKNIYSRKRGNQSRERVYTKPGGTNSLSNERAVVRYRKPKTYTSPSTRSTGTSREYKTPKINQTRNSTYKKTVKRIVTNPNRTKNYSTPNRSTRNYSTPNRSKSRQYKTPTRSSRTKTYSTPSKSTRSKSSGSSSRTVSSPSRSSSSGSSPTRSSGGSSRGGRKR